MEASALSASSKKYTRRPLQPRFLVESPGRPPSHERLCQTKEMERCGAAAAEQLRPALSSSVACIALEQFMDCDPSTETTVNTQMDANGGDKHTTHDLAVCLEDGTTQRVPLIGNSHEISPQVVGFVHLQNGEFTLCSNYEETTEEQSDSVCDAFVVNFDEFQSASGFVSSMNSDQRQSVSIANGVEQGAHHLIELKEFSQELMSENLTDQGPAEGVKYKRLISKQNDFGNSVTKSKNETLFCPKCEITFTSRSNLFRHNRRLHPLGSPPLPGSVPQEAIETHGRSVRRRPSPNDSVETLSFYTNEDFNQWKKKVESETASRYIKERSVKLTAGGVGIMTYRCHRSGHYRPGGTGKRRLKSAGSNKIGSICGAFIKTKTTVVGEDREICVTYQPHHSGHLPEIGRVPLSREEKNKIATHLMQGIPKSLILEDIANKFSPSRRLSYTTRKDLHNIAASYNINDKSTTQIANIAATFNIDDKSVTPVASDSVSVNMWVEEMLEDPNNVILLYDPQGEGRADSIQLQEAQYILQTDGSEGTDSQLVLDGASGNERTGEIQAITVQIAEQEEPNPIDVKKDEIRASLNGLLSVLDEFTTEEEVDVILKSFASMRSKLVALKRSCNTNAASTGRRQKSVNKKVGTLQRRNLVPRLCQAVHQPELKILDPEMAAIQTILEIQQAPM